MVNFKKTLFIDLSVALIIIFALLGGLLFFGSNISDSAAAIVSLRQNLVNRSANLKSLATLKAQYAGPVQSYFNILHNIVPTKDQLIDLPKDFESLAKQQNLGFGFSFAGETQPAGNILGTVIFKLNVQGTNLDQIFKFVQSLQNFHFLTALDSFNLNGPSGNIQMTIIGRIFYR